MNPMIFISLALLLVIGYSFGSLIYQYYVWGNIDLAANGPKLVLMGFLCSMIYLGKNWARIIVGILALVSLVGMLASIALHLYTGGENQTHPYTYINFTVYIIVGLLLFFPKVVRNHYKQLKNQTTHNNKVNARLRPDR